MAGTSNIESFVDLRCRQPDPAMQDDCAGVARLDAPRRRVIIRSHTPEDREEDQPMEKKQSRRTVLASCAAAAAAISVTSRSRVNAQEVAAKAPKHPFIYCLNTSTIMGQRLKLPQQIDIAAKAGYTALEPWIRDIEAYAKEGGNLNDIRKQLDDHGMTVEDTIGFANWIVDDDEARKKGMEQAKRDMDLSVGIGSKRIAAPAAGAQDTTGMDLIQIAERYRALCDLGDEMGIVPIVEVWGFSRTIGKLSEGAFVAIQSGHPKASILADIYHLYKGGSDYNGLRLLNRQAIQIMHFNDYPNAPARAEIKDEHRIFPGDGVAPTTEILKIVSAMGNPPCILSLELFNRQYWKLDPMVCAKTGIDKMKAAVERSLA
jgi:sugar phosphate isomerase/epimerase